MRISAGMVLVDRHGYQWNVVTEVIKNSLLVNPRYQLMRVLDGITLTISVNDMMYNKWAVLVPREVKVECDWGTK